MFYLDGVHSPESMEVGSNWFYIVIVGDNSRKDSAQVRKIKAQDCDMEMLVLFFE